MIPKYVQDKIEDVTKSGVWDKTSIGYGYYLAMSELKPIIDAARNCVISGNGVDIDKLESLIKEFDQRNKEQNQIHDTNDV